MRRSLKKGLFVLLSIMLVLGSSCSSKKSDAAVTDEEVTLTMVVWDKANTTYLQPLVDAYTAKNPDVSIEFIDIPANEYQDKLSIMLSGGETADLISVKDIPGYAAMVNRKHILPLNEFIEKDSYDLAQYSGVTNDITVDGNLYALPFRSDFWILYYNKDLFDAAGVPYPTSETTWAEYEDMARNVASGSGANRVYGTHYHTWRSTVQLATVQDGKNQIITDNYSFMKPIYDMVIDMQDDEVVMDYSSQKVGNIHYSSLWYNERIAMMPMGSWFISTLITKIKEGEADMNWGIAKYPVPAGVAPGTTAGTLTSMAINANSKNKAAAWDFIKFFCGPEGAEVLAKVGNFPAIRNDAVIDILANMDGFPADATSREALRTSTVRLEMPMHDKVGTVERILNEEHELIMTGSVSVDEGIAEMTRRVGEALNE